MFLPGQRDDNPGIIVSVRRQLVDAIFTRYFNSRPLRPEIEACRRFDGFGDVRTSDSCGGLQEIKLPIVPAFDELGVCYATHQTKRCENLAVDRIESPRVG